MKGKDRILAITRRTIIIAFLIGLETVIGIICLRWDPYNDGIVEKDGIVYEMPRADAAMEYNTRYFDKMQYERMVGNQKHVLTWYFRAPVHAVPGRKYPLVMVLHGRPGLAYAAEHMVMTEMERDFPAFVFVPTAPVSYAWAVPEKKDSPYAQFVDRQSLPGAMEILTHVMQDYPVDKNRVYIIGCSEGGIGVLGAVLRYPDVFAAAVAVSSTWDVDEAPQMTKVPLWIKHGAQDPALPAATARAIAESIRTHGGNVQYTEIPDMGHACPSATLYPRELWEWMFEQRRG